MRRVLPMAALEHFLATARRLSFRRAAEDLNVTPGAVSQRIKQLEDILEKPLFHRGSKSITLTFEGEILRHTAEMIFMQLDATVSRIRNTKRKNTLTLCVGPYFGAHWLSRRLGGFWSRNPDIELILRHPTSLIQGDHTEIDLAILWGDRSLPNFLSERLFECSFVPVCSQELLKDHRDIAQLVKSTRLLHFRGREQWRDCLRAIGLDPAAAERGEIIDDYNLLMEAATNGHGIALGTRPFVDEDIKGGRLTVLSKHSFKSEQTYSVHYRNDGEHERLIDTFRQWLVSESDLMSQVDGGTNPSLSTSCNASDENPAIGGSKAREGRPAEIHCS